MDSSTTLNSVKYGSIECRYFPMPTRGMPYEVELIYINRGEGICFAGDGIAPFNTGDVLLFGGHIPHYLRSAPQFYRPQFPLKCGSTYIRFNHDILPAKLYAVKECTAIGELIAAAQHGLRWSADSIDRRIVAQIEMMEQLNGFERLLQLYDLLNKMGGMLDRATKIASDRVVAPQAKSKICSSTIEYIIKNFNQHITLEELAQNAQINKTALCRHFKLHAGLSIFDFLLELRIEYAKAQLRTTKLTISEVAAEAGFNNLPNFNVQFKRLTGCTPGEYRAEGNY